LLFWTDLAGTRVDACADPALERRRTQNIVARRFAHAVHANFIFRAGYLGTSLLYAKAAGVVADVRQGGTVELAGAARRHAVTVETDLVVATEITFIDCAVAVIVSAVTTNGPTLRSIRSQ
jgi:hypothetical protein